MNRVSHAFTLQINWTYTNLSIKTIAFTTVLPIRVTLVASADSTTLVRKMKIDVF
jgi:hypothetical protein